MLDSLSYIGTPLQPWGGLKSCTENRDCYFGENNASALIQCFPMSHEGDIGFYCTCEPILGLTGDNCDSSSQTSKVYGALSLLLALTSTIGALIAMEHIHILFKQNLKCKTLLPQGVALQLSLAATFLAGASWATNEMLLGLSPSSDGLILGNTLFIPLFIATWAINQGILLLVLIPHRLVMTKLRYKFRYQRELLSSLAVAYAAQAVVIVYFTYQFKYDMAVVAMIPSILIQPGVIFLYAKNLQRALAQTRTANTSGAAGADNNSGRTVIESSARCMIKEWSNRTFKLSLALGITACFQIIGCSLFAYMYSTLILDPREPKTIYALMSVIFTVFGSMVAGNFYILLYASSNNSQVAEGVLGKVQNMTRRSSVDIQSDSTMPRRSSLHTQSDSTMPRRSSLDIQIGSAQVAQV